MIINQFKMPLLSATVENGHLLLTLKNKQINGLEKCILKIILKLVNLNYIRQFKQK